MIENEQLGRLFIKSHKFNLELALQLFLDKRDLIILLLNQKPHIESVLILLLREDTLGRAGALQNILDGNH